MENDFRKNFMNRIIIVENPIETKEEWLDILRVLTLKETIAFSEAVQQWAIENNFPKKEA